MQHCFQKHSSYVRSSLLLTLLVANLGITGCMSSARINNQASVGQQLQDLEKSYNAGIITPKEYQRLKKALINKND